MGGCRFENSTVLIQQSALVPHKKLKSNKDKNPHWPSNKSFIWPALTTAFSATVQPWNKRSAPMHVQSTFHSPVEWVSASGKGFQIKRWYFQINLSFYCTSFPTSPPNVLPPEKLVCLLPSHKSLSPILVQDSEEWSVSETADWPDIYILIPVHNSATFFLCNALQMPFSGFLALWTPCRVLWFQED